MRILRTKKAKLNFVIAAFASCFCMMLVTPFIGEQFGFANSFSNVYLDGEYIGAIKDPANVESLLLDARLQLAQEQKTMVLAEVDCYYTPVETLFSNSMSEDELYDILYEHLKTASVDIQRAYMMKIGTYTVYLDNIEDVYEVLELAKTKYDPNSLFQVNIIADSEREINMYTAELISSDIQIQDVETVGIRVSEIPLQEIVQNAEEESDETAEPEPEEETEETAEPEQEPGEDGLKAMSFGEKVEISEAYVSMDLITTPEEAADQITKESQKNEIYEVQSGDTLSTIANNHGLYVKDVVALNSGLTENTVLQIGDEIIITVPQPELTVMTVEQSTYEEEYYGEVEYVYNDDWYTTKSVVLQEEEAGYHEVTALITKRNGTEESREMINEVVIKEPVCKIVEKGTQTPPTYIKPISGGRLSSNYGGRKAPTKGASTNHKGIDWATPTGTAVMASSGGTVSVAGWQSGYGYVVYINHPDGRQTRYGHLSKILVSVGQKVQQGQKIALSGNTGRSTGPHLHFELRINGQAVNPLNYL
ncbi:MAG: M23 family metallopeptidase [Lachnospiraceae bacterium]|nr:M23 family metallopeptidase [Lachnospiraceae bacterium]